MRKLKPPLPAYIPYDLLNAYEELPARGFFTYYLGAIRYDRRGWGEKELDIWKLAMTARMMHAHGLVNLFLKRHGEFLYEYSFQKRGDAELPTEVIREAEKIEARRTIGGFNY